MIFISNLALVIIYGMWLKSLVKNIRLQDQIDSLNKQNQFLKDRISNLERNVREEANKTIILESLLKQRSNNQDEDRKIY
jgi:cell division protein FtsB